MSRRSIRKRRHRYWPSLSAMMNRADVEFVAQAAVYERWFVSTGANMLSAIEKNDAWWHLLRKHEIRTSPVDVDSLGVVAASAGVEVIHWSNHGSSLHTPAYSRLKREEFDGL